MLSVKSLLLAIDAARGVRERAVAELALSQQNLQYAQSQFDQLERYAADTAARWCNSSGLQISVELLRHQSQFLDRLHHAMGLQGDVLKNLMNQTNETKVRLIATEVRLAGLLKIQEKQIQAQAVVDGRRDQRQMDEFAATQHAKFALQRTSGD